MWVVGVYGGWGLGGFGVRLGSGSRCASAVLMRVAYASS